MLAKSILDTQNVRSTTLPADFNYNPDNILQLFLKPAVKVRGFQSPSGSRHRALAPPEPEDALGAEAGPARLWLTRSGGGLLLCSTRRRRSQQVMKE